MAISAIIAIRFSIIVGRLL